MPSHLALAGLLTPLVAAVSLPDATYGPGFVAVPLVAHTRDNVLLQRRATDKTSALELPTYGGNSGWVINITIGNPGQATAVSIDTGSSELWVDPDCASAGWNKDSGNPDVVFANDPLHDPKACEARGRYDPSKSSSKKQLDTAGRKFQYGDSTTAYINYYSDTLDFGGLKISDQIFGVANASNQTGIGIMGMSPPPGGFGNNAPYPLILKTMADQGVINTPAFSLDLRDQSNSTGTLIFGGVDKGRYQGSLSSVALETVRRSQNGQSYDDFGTYYINVTKVTILSPDSGSPSKDADIDGGIFAGGLDCGSGAMLLPKGIAGQVCDTLKGDSKKVAGTCIVDCAYRSKPGGVTFQLKPRDVTVTWENLISQNGDGASATCTLAMQDTPFTTTSPPGYLLGAPFLRAVYAVFDWNTSSVYLADTASCASNIVAIGTGPDGIPGGPGDCNKKSAAAGLAVSSWLGFVVMAVTTLVLGLL